MFSSKFRAGREPDGLLRDEWNILVPLVEAAQALDFEEFYQRGRAMARSRAGKRGRAVVSFIYLDHLISSAMFRAFGDRLTRQRVIEIASDMRGDFVRAWPQPDFPVPNVFQVILLQTLGLDDSDQVKVRVDMVAPMEAALGVLLRAAGQDLAALRPDLAKWCEENRAMRPELGL